MTQIALLVSTFKSPSEKQECEEHLVELSLLAKTYGFETALKVPVLLKAIDTANYVSKGKLEELIALSNELNVDLILFDEEISPTQQRNLEEIFKKRVMDRTELILGVFAQRAQTKEAKLQIELAKTRYEKPRLKRLWTHLSRQSGTSGGGGSGGGGYNRGVGEKQIEIDKRLIKERIQKLNEEIEGVKAVRDTQRIRRKKSAVPTFAIIGYTNAGKSSLLNSLTDANVFVEDKLFATLDTTTRKFELPNNQEILLIDTVGFIRKLPHLLVAAFKSTLEESLEADILLHIIDVSNPLAEEQALTSFEVLKELNAKEKPMITVLNKVDLCPESKMIQKLKIKYPKNVTLSALTKEGFEELYQLMVDEISNLRSRMTLRIPQSRYDLVAEVIQLGRVYSQDYEENDVILDVDLPKPLASKLKEYEQKV